MKATGAELMAFYNEWPLGNDYYTDDGMYDDEGDLNLNPDEEYHVTDAIGYLCWRGDGKIPSSIEINGTIVVIPRNRMGPNVEEVFKAWRGTKILYLVMLGPEQVDSFRAACLEHGWGILVSTS